MTDSNEHTHLPLWSQQRSLWELAQESSEEHAVPSDDPQPLGTWGGGRAIRLGNRQLKVSLWGPPDQLTWSINKTDIWDRRLFLERPMTLEQIRERCFDPSYDENPFNNQNSYYLSYSAYDFPCPKPAGQLILRSPDMQGAGTPVASVHHSDGRVDVPLQSSTTSGSVQSLVMMPRNIILVSGQFTGLTQPLQVRLYRHRDTIRHGESWLAGGGPEPKSKPGYDYAADHPANGPLEPPTAVKEGRFFWIRQEFPGEKTFPQGFGYVLMALVAEEGYEVEVVENETGLGTPPYFSITAHGGEGSQDRETLSFHAILPWYEPIRKAPGVAATATIPGHEITLFATVVTRAEAEDPVAAAKEQLLQAERDGPEALMAENRAWWEELYDRREDGRIYFSEPEENLQEVRDVFRSWTWHHSGGTCPDLSQWEGDAAYAYMEQDWSPWHADNHFNEAEYTSSCIRNRIDRLQMWYDIGEFVLPLAQRNAREVYGCRGAMCGLTHVPVRTETIYHSSVVWEQGMEMMAQLARMFWQRYDHAGDIDFLRDRAYPVLRSGAEFYVDYLTRDENGIYHVIPTVSQEHWSLTHRFSRNQDSISALCMIRWHLQTAARAAQMLQVDTDRVEEWRHIAEQLADYPVHEAEEGPIFVDVPGAPPIEYNLVPVVYPSVLADEITLDSPPDVLEIMERTVRHASGWGHLSTAKTVILCTPGTGPENLLNGRSGILHLFPAVKEKTDIGFRRFLAKGAFEVSAEYVGGNVSPVLIRSLAGNDLRLVNPWEGKNAVAYDITGDHPAEIAADKGRHELLTVRTEAGHTYRIQAG